MNHAFFTLNSINETNMKDKDKRKQFKYTAFSSILDRRSSNMEKVKNTKNKH